MSSKKRDYTQPSEREVELTNLVNGIQKSFPGNASIMVDGVSYTQATFLSTSQSFLTPEVASRQGHLTLQALIAAKDANEKPADAWVSNAKKALIVFVGAKNVSGLAAYGITPPKERAKATGAQNVIKAAKASETRQARDTMSPKEKAAIKGSTPSSVTVTKTGKIVPSSPTPKAGGSTT
jgi:hypothetical protein